MSWMWGDNNAYPPGSWNSTSKGSCSVLFKNKNCWMQTVVFGGSVHFLISFPLFSPSFWSSRIYSTTGAHFFVAIGAGQVIVSLRHGILVTCLHMRDRNQNLQAENWGCSVQHCLWFFSWLIWEIFTSWLARRCFSSFRNGA